jgi:hypothetical protein
VLRRSVRTQQGSGMMALKSRHAIPLAHKFSTCLALLEVQVADHAHRVAPAQRHLPLRIVHELAKDGLVRRGPVVHVCSVFVGFIEQN